MVRLVSVCTAIDVETVGTTSVEVTTLVDVSTVSTVDVLGVPETVSVVRYNDVCLIV